MTTELEAHRLMKTCPSFNTCSCPSCPLDLKQALRPVYPGEPTCHAHRSTRMALAQGTELPHGGLTHREVVREEKRKRWNAKPQEVRDAIVNRLRRNLHPDL